VPTLAIDMSVEEILSGSGSNMMLNQGVTEVNPTNNVGNRTPLSLNPTACCCRRGDGQR